MFDQLAVLSAFLGPDQSATETLLASDPEVAPWVQKYQRSRETVSQTDYEVRSSMIALSLDRNEVPEALLFGLKNTCCFLWFLYFFFSFQVDLITTFTKLSTLGQQINYEAYTYPPPKIDITKLKL